MKRPEGGQIREAQPGPRVEVEQQDVNWREKAEQIRRIRELDSEWNALEGDSECLDRMEADPWFKRFVYEASRIRINTRDELYDAAGITEDDEIRYLDEHHPRIEGHNEEG